jgi:hypothetical protein
MDEYPSLKDAVLDLDPILIDTLAAFWIEQRREGLVVLFRFAWYGPQLEDSRNVEQYPDREALLPGSLDPEEEIRGLEESELLGSFNSMQLRPHVPGNPTDKPKWVVKTHAGSQAERIQWRNSIG